MATVRYVRLLRLTKNLKNVSHLTWGTGQNFQLSGKQSAFTKDVHSFLLVGTGLRSANAALNYLHQTFIKMKSQKKLFQFHKVLNPRPKIALVTCVSCFSVINIKKVQAVVRSSFSKMLTDTNWVIKI